MFKTSTLRRILASEGLFKTAYANTLSYKVQLGSDSANYDATTRGMDDIPNYRDTAKQVKRMLMRSDIVDDVSVDPRRGTLKVYMIFPDHVDVKDALYKGEDRLGNLFKKIGKGHDHHRYFLYGSIDGDYSDFKIEDGEVESWSD